MTQLNFTINSDKFLDEVLQSDLKTATKGIITALLNQAMEAERDSYIQASAYERTGNRQDYRNGYYERDYTIKADTKSPQGAKNALWWVLYRCFSEVLTNESSTYNVYS